MTEAPFMPKITVVYRIPLQNSGGDCDWTLQLSNEEGNVGVELYWKDKDTPNHTALVDGAGFMEMARRLFNEE